MKLHDYQVQAVNFLVSHHRAALFLDMGLGKTLISLSALNQCLESEPGLRCLVVAPKGAAMSTWMREPLKWREILPYVDEPVSLIGGRKARTQGMSRESNLKVINRDCISDLIKEEGGLREFDILIIDELTSFKSPKSQRFKMLSKNIHSGLTVWGLTGTPLAQGLQDLWAQIYLLDQGARLEKSYYKFLNRFFVPVKKNWKTGQVYSYSPRVVAPREISGLIGDLVLRMRAEDYLDMPRLVDEVVEVAASRRARDAYQALARDMILETAQGEVTAVSASALVGKLQQLASGSVYVESPSGERVVEFVHAMKVEALREIVELAGEPVLVAVWFRSDLERLCGEVGGVGLDSVERIEAWNRGEIGVGLMNPASLGHGVNLQEGGRILVFYTPIWSGELRQQTVGRLYRQGQSRPVLVKNLCLSGSVDFDVLGSTGSKKELQDLVLRLVDEVKTT